MRVQSKNVENMILMSLKLLYNAANVEEEALDTLALRIGEMKLKKMKKNQNRSMYR